MKLTLSWLKDHLDTHASADAVAEALTRVGLEVEAVEDRGKLLAPFVIARVVEARPHPNADRLRVCLVDVGDGAAPTQVVCGAPNARTGMIGVFSPVGTYIPGKDMTLGKGVIRGVESLGMLCSEAELLISENHDGIIDLPQDAPVGAPFAPWAGLDDATIEVSVTPNRADALGVAGIARDLAAVGLGRLKTPPVAPIRGDFPCPVGVRLDLAPEDAHLCPAFALRLVRGVRNGPSPDWLRRRLTAIGLRPINALVDVTNFLTYDRARPLHVFDAGKVHGDLTVRRARPGESLRALDGRDYAFDPSMVVIADARGVESIGGIMGGEATGCDEATVDVLIESALWDPLNIARSGRALGVNSDARHRFERGVDPAFAVAGLDLATRLILDLCGGEASEIAFAGAIPDTSRTIRFPYAETARLTGLEVDPDRADATLRALGFAVTRLDPASAEVAPPSWRADVAGKADLVEEVTRIAGLDAVKATPFPRETPGVPKPILTPLQKRARLARRALAARGLVEAVTWSFIARDAALAFGGGSADLALANPIAADLSDMRPSLLPGLLRAAQRNADRGFGDLALFEVGQVFRSDAPEGQTLAAAGLRRGLARPDGNGRHWRGSGEADAFDVKADLLAILDALGAPTGGLQIVAPGPAWLHPGRSATVRFGPKGVVGCFGEAHPRMLKALDVKGPVVVFELTLDALPAAKARPTRMKPKLALSDLQPVERDFAFIVDRDLPAGDLARVAEAADRTLVSAVAVFDVYQGPGVPEGKKSVALAVTLQPTERTLTDAEIDAVATKIASEAAKRCGASLRA